jgi:hypothetical protein
MEDKITNIKFLEAWKEVCKENKAKLLQLSDDTSAYTDFILKNNNCIIEKIATKLGLEHFPEYYKIDAVLYDPSDYISCPSEHKTWGREMGYWLKRIIVAFEHENNLKTAYQEIAHLLITEAKIKVVVTYAEKNNTKNHAKDFCKILENFKNNYTPILVIFGCYDVTQTQGKYEWIGYELTKEGPKEL